MDGLRDVPLIPVNNATSDIFLHPKDRGLRSVVGITCCLSIIGSLLIILSYAVLKSRPKTREILLHISLMDLGVSLANLIGLAVFFDRFYRTADGIPLNPPDHIDRLCKTQAFFAAFCTLGSVFWTTALAGYVYIVTLYNKEPNYAINFARFCYFLCYSMPLGIALWLVVTNRLGYSPYNSSGWCSLIAKDPNTGSNDLFILVFAHDLWMFVSITLIIVLYITVRSFVSSQLRESHNMPGPRSWSSMDYKFIMIPLLFVLLRMWTVILGVLVEYAGLSTHVHSAFWKILIYLSGIGDSGQGFTNAILFIVFTKSVRDSFIRCICCGKGRGVEYEPVTTSSESSSPSSVHKMTHTGSAGGSYAPRYGSVEVNPSLFKSMAGDTGTLNTDAKAS